MKMLASHRIHEFKKLNLKTETPKIPQITSKIKGIHYATRDGIGFLKEEKKNPRKQNSTSTETSISETKQNVHKIMHNGDQEAQNSKNFNSEIRGCNPKIPQSRP